MNVLQQLQQAYARMDRVRKELEAASFEGTAAGGAVRVVLTGRNELAEVAIDPDLLAEGAETVAEVVRAAYAVALGNKTRAEKEKLAQASKGLLPPGMLIPGLG